MEQFEIVNVNYRNCGDYKCIANNPGGQSERNITLVNMPGPLTGRGVAGPLSSTTYWTTELALGFIVIFLIILVVLSFFYRKC